VIQPVGRGEHAEGAVAVTPVQSSLLIDPAVWEQYSAAALVEVLEELVPKGSAIASYSGPDLFAAKPLPPAELAELYTWPTDEFVAGQTFKQKEDWLRIVGENSELKGWINRGGYSEFMRDWAERVPVTKRENNQNTQQDPEFVDSEIASLLKVGSVERVTHLKDSPEEVRVVAPLTVATQDGGKKRLCWNGRPTNVGLDAQRFKMEHVQTVARMLRPGDVMMTCDLKAGYHQVPCTQWFSKFLCFEWRGEVYRWNVMPFGLSTAPRAFTKLVRALVKKWRAAGIRCSNFIDDFIWIVRPHEAAAVRQTVLQDFGSLGLYLSVQKCMLQPGTMVQYLGVLICTVPEPHLRMPDGKIVKLRDSLRRILHQAQGVRVGEVMAPPPGQVQQPPVQGDHSEIQVEGVGVRVTGRVLARLLGMLQFFRAAVPLVAVFTKALYQCMRDLQLDESGWVNFDDSVLLSQQALRECEFWYNNVKRWNGFALKPRTVSRVLYTDGSGYGYAGVLHRVQHRQMEPALEWSSGVWEQQAPTASVFTELQGLWRALVAAGSSLLGQTVLHRTDSISTYWVLRNGGSRSERLNTIARRVAVYCAAFNIHLAMEYVGSEVIIKSGADMLSRATDETECMLEAGVYGRLWRLFGGWEVDRFASGGSAQLDLAAGRRLPYWSLYADGAAEGIDALSASWAGKRNYAFPPVKLVGQTLELILEQQATTVLIAPKWESQWWWPMLVEAVVLVVDLRPLLAGPHLFCPVRGNGLTHPLGKLAASPHSTQWVAAYMRF
jgi:hypothetical protein